MCFFQKYCKSRFQFVLYFEYFNLYLNKELLADVFNFESARAGVKWPLVLANFPEDNFQESPSVWADGTKIPIKIDFTG